MCDLGLFFRVEYSLGRLVEISVSDGYVEKGIIVEISIYFESITHDGFIKTSIFWDDRRLCGKEHILERLCREIFDCDVF